MPFQTGPTTRSYPRLSFDEGLKGSEIVTVVRVAHDHELSVSGLDPHLQRLAIAALRNGDDARTKGFRNFHGPIDAAVVRDYDLTQEILSSKIRLRFRNTGAQSPSLIETGHQDRKRDYLFD